MLPKRFILSLICGFKCKFVCKSIYSCKKSSFVQFLKLSFIILLTILIFAPTLHVVYNDIRFSIKYNRNRESSYQHFLKMPDSIEVEDSLEGDYDEFLMNYTMSANDLLYPTSNSNSTYNVYNTTDEATVKNCSIAPKTLRGRIPVIYPHRVFHMAKNVTKLMLEIAEENLDVNMGGWWKPGDCLSLYHVAVIIPYRNRSEHLVLLLKQLHIVLKRQLIYYQIFVVEQESPETFNKALLMNVAYANISKDYDFDCFVFHDVDLLMENDRNMYACIRSPMHLSPAVDTLKYRLPYHELIGGVLAIRPEHFEQVNGYSNMYWGWGGEDDDLYYRLESENITVYRPNIKIGRYKMLRHKGRKAIKDKKRFSLVWSAKDRYQKDGLNQLHNFNCTVISVNKQKLYTHLLVDLGNEPTEK